MIKKTKSILLPITVTMMTAIGAHAFGNDREWQAGGGQGVDEAIITSGADNRILVSCDNDPNTEYSNISFTIGGDTPKGKTLIMTFDGADPEQVQVQQPGTITSNCHACASWFNTITDKLKRHNRVHVMTESGDGANFTLKGAAAAIGNCSDDFSQY